MPRRLSAHHSGLSMGSDFFFTVNHAREGASLPLSLNLSSMFSLTVIFIMFLVSCAPDRCLGTHHRPDLPGPRRWPLLGNTLDIFLNRKRMLLRFHELSSYFGELFTVTLPMWGRIIIINHPEWLEHVKKGALYHNSRSRILICRRHTQRTRSDTEKERQPSLSLPNFRVSAALSGLKEQTGAGSTKSHSTSLTATTRHFNSQTYQAHIYRRLVQHSCLRCDEHST